MNTTTDTPKIFLTDYASYNEGSQFEFGHWELAARDLMYDYCESNGHYFRSI